MNREKFLLKLHTSNNEYVVFFCEIMNLFREREVPTDGIYDWVRTQQYLSENDLYSDPFGNDATALKRARFSQLLEKMNILGPKNSMKIRRYWDFVFNEIRSWHIILNWNVFFEDERHHKLTSSRYNHISNYGILFHQISKGYYPSKHSSHKGMGDGIAPKYEDGRKLSKEEREHAKKVSNRGHEFLRMKYIDITANGVKFYEEMGWTPMVVCEQSNDTRHAYWQYLNITSYTTKLDLQMSHHLFSRSIRHDASWLKQTIGFKMPKMSDLYHSIDNDIKDSSVLYLALMRKWKSTRLSLNGIILFIDLFQSAYLLNTDLKSGKRREVENIFGTLFQTNKEMDEQVQDLETIYNRFILLMHRLGLEKIDPEVEILVDMYDTQYLHRKRRKLSPIKYTIGNRTQRLRLRSFKKSKLPFDERLLNIFILASLKSIPYDVRLAVDDTISILLSNEELEVVNSTHDTLYDSYIICCKAIDKTDLSPSKKRGHKKTLLEEYVKNYVNT